MNHKKNIYPESAVSPENNQQLCYCGQRKQANQNGDNQNMKESGSVPINHRSCQVEPHCNGYCQRNSGMDRTIVG